MTIYNTLLDILERVEVLEEQLESVLHEVRDIKVVVQLKLPEGEDDDTFLLENNSD